jgi:PAT family beta-lactamase induction signal transducer AmpG
MALCPHSERAHTDFTIVYAIVSGMCFAGFSAVILEAIGRGAAATKYNLYASRSSVPICYMTLLEAWARPQWGINGFLYLEAGMTVVSQIFGAAVVLSARRVSRWQQSAYVRSRRIRFDVGSGRSTGHGATSAAPRCS